MPKKIDTAGLKHFKDKENAMVASEFSASKSYAIGEYVYYKGTLYKFKAAHAAGAWTTSDVEAAKLAGDVSVLKESTNDLKTAINSNLVGRNVTGWEQGSFDTTNGGNYNSNTAIRNQTKFGISSGVARITCEDNYIMLLYAWNENDTYIGAIKTDMSISKTTSGWKSFKDFDCSLFPNYTFKIVLLNSNTSTYITPDNGVNCYIIYFDSIKKEIAELETILLSENSGYISANGEINAATSPNYEVYTSPVDIKNGQKIHTLLEYPDAQSMWLAYVLYDVNGKFLSRTIIINSVTQSKFSGAVLVSNSQASTIVFTYRTFGTHTFVAKTNTPESALNGINRLNSNNRKFYSSYNSNVKSINHRGYNSVAPENTLPAFRMSRLYGFDRVETDVNFTSDGVAVLLHDLTINRTARNADGSEISSTININDITYEEALDYDFGIWKGQQYAGTKIPTFEQFIKLCKYIGLMPYIELKDDVTYTQSDIEGLVDIVHECGMNKNVSWISFNNTYLGYVKNYDSAARIGYLTDSINATKITNAQALKTTDNEVFISAATNYVTTEGINLCIAGNIPLEVWTVNYLSTLYGLNPYISGITSDYLVGSYELFKHNIS